MEYFYFAFAKYFHDIIRNVEDQNILELLVKKETHTYRVVNNIKEICIRENLSKKIQTLAEITALFHDIGRFKQQIDYKTFNDSISIDHAKLSGDVFMAFRDEMINYISSVEIDIIYNAIIYHNKLSIDEITDETTLLIAKLIRDADKINILSINLNSPFKSSNSFLSNEQNINPACLKSFKSNRVVSNKDVITVLDNKIKFLSWIHDLNFKSSLAMFLEEGFINILLDTKNIENQIVLDIIKELKNDVDSIIK